ncbi:MAG: hypothetical protein IT302_07385 [Dehalococcoidia bacterium]|nr:hypothetical protein [Dehalococcoidia bacterium]
MTAANRRPHLLAWAIGLLTVAVGLWAIVSPARHAHAQAPASLTVILDTRPDTPDDVAFTTEGDGLGPFVLDDDADPVHTNRVVIPGLAAGSYSIAGGELPGWNVTVSCDTAGLAGSQGATVRIAVGEGDNATCRYIYERSSLPAGSATPPVAVAATPQAQVASGAIAIAVSAPGGAPSRAFVTTALGGIGFELDGDDATALPSRTMFPALPAGTYRVELLDSAGLVLANVTCETGTSLVSVASRSVDVVVGAGETVACTFELTDGRAVANPPAAVSAETPPAASPTATAAAASTPDSRSQGAPLPPRTGTGRQSDGLRLAAVLATIGAMLAGASAAFLGPRR